MVDFRTPNRAPTARPADPVSTATSEGLTGLGRTMQRVADGFTNFYEAEAARQRELLTSKMQLEWSRRLEDTAKDAPDGYARNIMAEFDKWRGEAMQNAPKRGREDLEQTFGIYRIKLEDRAQRAEIAAREQRAAAAAAEAKRLANEALATEIRMAGNRLIREPSEELLAEFQALYPDQADDLTRTYDAARMLNDPAAVMADVREGRRDSIYTNSQMLNLLEAGAKAEERNERERLAAQAAALDDLNAAISEDAAFLEANGFAPTDSYAANPEALDLALGDLIDDPEERAQAKRAIEEQFALSRAVASVSTASSTEVDAEIGRLVARVREPGSTPEDQADLNRYVQALERRQQSLTDDAAGHVVRINDEVGALFGAVENAEDQEEAEIAASQYRAAARAEYDRLGVPDELRRVLPKGAADGIVQSLMQDGADTLPARLAEVVRVWGAEVVPELAAAGLPEVASVAMRYADKPALATSILGIAGQTRADLAEGLPNTTVTDMSAALEASLDEWRQAFESGDQTGQARQTFNAHYSVAERLILSRIRQGDSPTAAVDKVVSEMFPETALVSGRMRVLIPETANAGRVEAALSRALSDDMIRAFKPEPLIDPTFPEFANEELMVRAAQAGVWLNNSRGDGAVLAIDLGGYFLPVRNRAGQYYEVLYDSPMGLHSSLGAAGDPLGTFEQLPVSP